MSSPTQRSKAHLESGISDVLEIQLAGGAILQIDREDRNVLYGNKWTASTAGSTTYALRGKGKTREYMHRLISGAEKGQCVDHIDGNGLNNKKSNLRLCSKQQNTFNSKPRNPASGYKGVVRHYDKIRWCARITFDRKNIYLGTFDDAIDAAKAYDAAAQKYFGEFAQGNFK